jgi:hypothetical protein
MRIFSVLVTTDPKFTVPTQNSPLAENKSRVVVYRSLQESLSNDSMPVLDNGKEMGVLNVGEIGIYDTDPGYHEIYTDETGGKGRKAQVSMKPGETYYVKFTVYDDYLFRFISAAFISDEIPEKDALRDMRVLREQAEN